MSGVNPLRAYCVRTALQPVTMPVCDDKNIDTSLQPDCKRT